jgi:hypothetical protein
MQEKLEQKLAELTAEYHERAAGLTMAEAGKLAAKIKEARRKLQEFLAQGAKECALCSAAPLVVKHRRPAGPGLVIDVYEVGCLTDHKKHVERNRVYDPSLAGAIKAWNERQAELAA